MPRVREIADAGADETLRPLFDKERELFGDLLNTTKVLAHCPPILRAAKLLGASIEQSGQLPKSLPPLVYLRVALLNGCPFWIDINSFRVKDGADGEAKLAEVARWRDSDAFSDAERVALELAERMTITGQRVDDALFKRLGQHFSEAQIVELSAAIALENFRSKLNPALGVDAQGFCMLPARPPGWDQIRAFAFSSPRALLESASRRA